MKTKQFFYAIIFFIGLTATAQQAPFMVCDASGTTCAPYTTLDLAYAAAETGDYVYLPAGNFTLGVNITKQVHFIGAGFDPTGSITTGTTNIAGNLIITTAAIGSSFEGFYLSGNFLISGTVSNIALSYVNFNRTDPQAEGQGWVWNNCIVKNCVAREYLYLGSSNGQGSNNLVVNSIINSCHAMNLSIIKNCIINKFNPGSYSFYDIKNSIVKNCIIGSPGLTGTSLNVQFLNNATTANPGQLVNGIVNSSELNCVYNITAANTFVSATAFTYNQTLDYNIKTTSPANNGGDDATDMGIYGSNIPWKAGAIPSNPHIASKNISGTTDSSGNLPVQITVTTQN
jgi:hypothetical protein